MKPANHYPRIYDVPGEKLSLRIWDPSGGEDGQGKDLWYPISYGELRNLVGDGYDALMREMRRMEKG